MFSAGQDTPWTAWTATTTTIATGFSTSINTDSPSSPLSSSPTITTTLPLGSTPSLTTSPVSTNTPETEADTLSTPSRRLPNSIIGLIVVLLALFFVMLFACIWVCLKRRRRAREAMVEDDLCKVEKGVGYGDMVRREESGGVRPWAWDLVRGNSGRGVAGVDTVVAGPEKVDGKSNGGNGGEMVGLGVKSEQNGQTGLSEEGLMASLGIDLRHDFYNTPTRESPIMTAKDELTESDGVLTVTPPEPTTNTGASSFSTGTPPRPPRRSRPPLTKNGSTESATYNGILDSYTSDPTLPKPTTTANESVHSLSPPETTTITTGKAPVPKRLSPPFRNTTPTWAGQISPTSPIATKKSTEALLPSTKPKQKRDSTLSFASSLSPSVSPNKRASKQSRVSWASTISETPTPSSQTPTSTLSSPYTSSSSVSYNPKETNRMSDFGLSTPPGSDGIRSPVGSLMNESVMSLGGKERPGGFIYAYDSPEGSPPGEEGYVLNSSPY
ncbi:hypothetical protein HK097_005736 [Rhizophlyctis rosea]|uniref:Uncharacterized protein n=1 Tax=Rhizophlyctis rosea TaxID=64517 RepID=A0AAD5SD36_9FUNG|nr:hypothetical protein HK097_005736 [Rhizophlyctis rosea]